MYHRRVDGSPLPADHCQLALTPLADAMTAAYGLIPPVQLTLLRSWTNDVYTMVSGHENYILKVYRAGWKRPVDVEWEIQLQHWLASHGAPVTCVIPLQNGELFGTLTAPEGTRCFATFRNAGGEKPSPPFSPDLYYQYGYGTALLHQTSEGFSSQLPRFGRDLTNLLHQALDDIEPWLTDRPNDWQLVERIASRVREQIAPLEATLEWGICHGDLSLDNLNVVPDKGVTFYDFDLSCYGWRAWDVCNALGHNSQGHQDAFLRGYRHVRPISPDGIAVVPYFVAADALRMMGEEISRWTQWFGTWRVHTWVDTKLTELRTWDQSLHTS